MGAIILMLMISLASAAISFTITTTSIFKWLRELISPIHHKFEELIHCPWCLSHYITLTSLFFLFYDTVCFDINLLVHFILNFFFIQGVIGLIHYVLLRAYEPVAKAMVSRELKKLKQKRT